ncbi:MAG: hypothetical protein EHM42_14285 [Planctomycetaceae bacterium]|nr:MAG: hypothetical protein EHM42_14285 [Planctomycetaceae bacterium]
MALTNYPIAIHEQEGFPFGLGDPKPILPLTEKHSASVLSLPIYPELTGDDQEHVVRCLATALGRTPKRSLQSVLAGPNRRAAIHSPFARAMPGKE